MPTVSIIVPVYKVERYLSRCVDSILHQTFRDFELILVDDGSPDGCPALCEQYAKKDARVRVLHQKNGGLSAARNAGIEAAKAPHIAFVDSDDMIKPDMLQTLWRNLFWFGADISACGIVDCYPNGEETLRCSQGELLTLSDEEAVRVMLQGEKLSVNATNKLFKKELFLNLRFPPGRRSEDAFIMVRLFSKAHKVVLTTDAKYCYMHRADSITTSRFQFEDFDAVEAYSENLNFIGERYPGLKELATFRYLWSYFYVLEKMVFTEGFCDFGTFHEVTRVLRRHTFTVLKNPYFTKKRKLTAVVLLFSERLFRAVTRRKRSTLHKIRQNRD